MQLLLLQELEVEKGKLRGSLEALWAPGPLRGDRAGPAEGGGDGGAAETKGRGEDEDGEEEDEEDGGGGGADEDGADEDVADDRSDEVRPFAPQSLS